jgi:hypothetical protein
MYTTFNIVLFPLFKSLIGMSFFRGGFIILDAETPAQFVRGFQAQAPCTVHRKAYEFTSKMPPVLRANLLPRLLLWADPFQDEPPDLHDVGLYFFPDDNIAGSVLSSNCRVVIYEICRLRTVLYENIFSG